MARLPTLISLLAALALAPSLLAQPVTTVITHGFSLDGTKGAWVEGMADAILARAGQGGARGGAVCRYRQDTGAWQLFSGALDAEAPVVLIFRWLDDFEKTGPDWGFAEGAADALYAALRDPLFVDGGGGLISGIGLGDDRPLHLISHSRGACVNSEVAERFAHQGIVVDHVTTLDPHPVNGTLDPPVDFDWGDPVPRKWSNITWADNYWRDDRGLFGFLDFDGIPLPGALNVELEEDALECCAYTFSHSDTHLWYHGTIDTDPNPCDGEQCITDEMRATWWPDGFTKVGYYYAILGGGADERPGLPPGDAPEFVASLYGGDFDRGSFAGWLYHGGSVSGQIIDDGDASFLRLAAGGTAATHNRFFLHENAAAVVLDSRTLIAAADEELFIQLTDAFGTSFLLPTLALGTVGDWTTDQVFPIDGAMPRGRTYRLTVGVAAPDEIIDAVLDVDNVRIAVAAVDPCPADLDDSGAVDFGDLLAVLSAWGRCVGCPADLDDSESVDFSDLLIVLTAWGDCV